MTDSRISASLVLYKPNLPMLERTLKALQASAVEARQTMSLQLNLTLVDNSDDAFLHGRLRDWLEDFRLSVPDWTLNLVCATGNLGYGRGNNLVISQAISDYHLVINPDLFVESDALSKAVEFMQRQPYVGMLSPAVFGEDGERHFMCKRNPTLLVMFLRSFSPAWLQSQLSFVIDKFEMRDCDYSKTICPIEYPTGCFMFFRTAPLQTIGGFDPDFFLHYEDADIGRRMLKIARVVYVPEVRVVHQWARDTHRSWRAKLITVKSGLLYWRKWGGTFVSRNTEQFPVVPDSVEATLSPQFASSPRRSDLVMGSAGFIGQAALTDATAISAVFLTGRTSAVGLPLINLLLAQGLLVHSLGRKPLVEVDQQPNLQWSLLDMADPEQSLPDITANTLIHTASLWLLPSWLESFHARGVRRVVAFSSTSRFTKLSSASGYELEVVTKLVAAEEQVISQCERLGMAWTIFRPTLIYGGSAGDRNVADIARLIRKLGFFPVFGVGTGRRQPVNAADLANACLQSLAASASYNKAYNLSGGETLTYREMVGRIFETLGRQPRFIRIPLAAFRFAVMLARLHPRFAHLTADMALRMQSDLVFDHSDATRDFGYCPGNFDPSYLKVMR